MNKFWIVIVKCTSYWGFFSFIWSFSFDKAPSHQFSNFNRWDKTCRIQKPVHHPSFQDVPMYNSSHTRERAQRKNSAIEKKQRIISSVSQCERNRIEVWILIHST